MRKFEAPEMEIIKFCVDDILATSSREDEDGGEWGSVRSLELPILEG